MSGEDRIDYARDYAGVAIRGALRCAHCALKGRSEPNTAVTIMSGDAVCPDCLTVALPARRKAQDATRRIGRKP